MKHILGAAYYDLHTRLRNPTTCFSHDVREIYYVSQVANHLKPFPPEYHLLFTQGIIYLRKAAMDVLRQGLPEWFLNCDTDDCNEHGRAWLNEQFLEHATTDVFVFDPLYALQIMRESAAALEKLETSPMCLECRCRLPKFFSACRHFIWDQLPYFFGVDVTDWDIDDHGYEYYL